MELINQAKFNPILAVTETPVEGMVCLDACHCTGNCEDDEDYSD